MKIDKTFSIVCVSLFCLALVVAIGCGMQKEVLLSGRTMGTFYHVKVVTGYFADLSDLQAKIDARLEEINRSMSTYRPDSEISRFNQLPAGESMPVSEDFLKVLQVAGKIHTLSGGAWDGTVKPLVNLWGFGNTRPVSKAPPETAIKDRLRDTGFNHIQMSPSGRVGKDNPSITLDLASIAKGYGVDAVADLIRDQGYRQFLVEIGGEVVAEGLRRDGKPWVVGINRPSPQASPGTVYRAIAMSNSAMATSGDYRIFFELDGRRYSHVIDPRTGYPVSNGIASVSVLAPNCTLADGLATALMVMGIDAALALVNKLDKVECLIIEQVSGDTFRDHSSSGFPR